MQRIFLVMLAVSALLAAEEKPDLSVLNRIKAEAFQNSQVMDQLFYLTDVYRPRLTNSPGYRAAGEWAIKRLRRYGLENVKAEKWGPFGQSWRLTRFSAHMLEPQYQTLMGVPLAWTAGTSGVVSGEPVMVSLKTRQILTNIGAS